MMNLVQRKKRMRNRKYEDKKAPEMITITAEYYHDLVKKADSYFHMRELITKYAEKKISDAEKLGCKTERQRGFLDGMATMYAHILSVLAENDWEYEDDD